MLKGNEKTLTDYAENLWTNDYTQIQYINAFFENSDRISDATQRERINGEAHFFRAYYYYMLWRSFGGVPLIDHTIDPLKNAERTPRASYAEMLEFIVKEADEAARILPVTQSSAETGRVTRGTALMLKAKAYLWAASEVYQDNSKAYLGFTDNQRQNMLKKAKAAYEDLFALNAYELIPIAARMSIVRYSSPRTARRVSWRYSILMMETIPTNLVTVWIAMPLPHHSQAPIALIPLHIIMCWNTACAMVQPMMPIILTTIWTIVSMPTSSMMALYLKVRHSTCIPQMV